MDRDALIREAQALIRIPSYRDCTPILEYAQDRLPFVPWQRQEVDKYANGHRQYNLYALLPDRPLVVNTHVDTVPPLSMPDPFTPRLEGNRVYGRGAVDTKGLLAALIVALETFYREQGVVPVSLALTVDEENNAAVGSVSLAALLQEQARYVVVLEPTEGVICTRQKGSLEFRLHAEAPVYHAAAFQQAHNPVRLLVEAWQTLEKALARPLNVFSFQGGWEYYATPHRAELLGEFVLEPGDAWEKVESTMQQVLARPPFTGRVTYERVDVENPWDFGYHPGTKALVQAYERALGRPPTLGIMPSWTDAANFAKVGLQCVVFGFGELAVAHSEREYITVEDLERNARVLYNLFTILTQ